MDDTVNKQVDISICAKQDTFALNASFSVPEKGITALFGPSGAGKTTLLRALAGLNDCQGKIVVGDTVWQDERTCLPAHDRRVGYVFQEPSLFRHMSVRKNLFYGYNRVDEDDRQLHPEGIIELLGLGRLMDRYSHQLSGGERQRVSIGRALLTSPQLLLMDEPLTSLDAEHREDLLPFLDRLHEELHIPALYVSHSPNEVARLADHLVLINDGDVIAAGPINTVLTRFDLPVAFHRDASAVIDAQASDYDDHYGLSVVEFDGGQLTIPGELPKHSSRVRTRILARDVSLTLEQHSDTSIINVLPATVAATAEASHSQVLVQLDVGNSKLLARITKKSADHLQLTKGQQVYAQVKSAAMLSS